MTIDTDQERHAEVSREGCEFPHNAPRTAYDKGCRCAGCREAKQGGARRYYEENREAMLEKSRRYQAENQVATQARRRRYKERAKALTPATITGPYSEAEDALILKWEFGDVALAQALGRTYGSVVFHKQTLRKKGLLTRDTS